MAGKVYRGHKGTWGRDKGSVPGHPEKTTRMNVPGQKHTPFQARGFHEDKGSNTRPESIHTNFTNVHKHDPGRAPTNVEGGHDARPEHYHDNSGTRSEGHMLIQRGASKYPKG